jgi:hypothetical protein
VNFFKKKNQQRIAVVICAILVVAMVIPMVLEFLV